MMNTARSAESILLNIPQIYTIFYINGTIDTKNTPSHVRLAVFPLPGHRNPHFRVRKVADGDGEVGADVTFAAVAQYFSTEVHDQIQALICDLDLEFLGWRRLKREKYPKKSKGARSVEDISVNL